MKKKQSATIRLVFLCVTAFCLTACHTLRKTPEAPAENAQVKTEAEMQQQMQLQMQDFSFRLLAQTDKNENYVVSPFSVQMALGMLLNGADGKTAIEIAQAMGFETNDLQMANHCFQTLMQTLPNLDSVVTVNIGNALFANQSIPLKKHFIDETVQYFNAEATNLDFSKTKESADHINDWCKEKTNGLIPKMIEETDPQTLAILLNAVYFNGKWKKPFKPSDTKAKKFTNESGISCETPMMMQTDAFRYGETAGMQCIRLPFGKGTYSMYILLPKTGTTISDLMAGLNAENWNSFKGKMQQTDVDVWLPKFETSSSFNLKPTLKGMGISDAFKPYIANLGKMTDREAFIHSIQQKALIKVFEEGAEAAAVTMIVEVDESEPPPPMPFHADHPFLYLIVEEQSGSILFAGRYHGNVAETKGMTAGTHENRQDLWQFQAFKRPNEYDLDEKEKEKEEGSDLIYTIVEEEPSFPGGDDAMFKFLAENLKWPCYEKHVEGTVIIEFVVEKDGSLSNIKVIRSVEPCLDQEAVRVIKLMPKWKPGRERGRVLRTLFRVPVTFEFKE
ncbi:MAG: TonB family protein [Bacteroidales bacterium]|nr:TonB family protein [Bacteroidales bacterium]